MIQQVFSVESYWKVIVFYSIDYNLFDIIKHELLVAGISTKTLNKIFYMLRTGRAKAATYNNLAKHISIVLFNKHKTEKDYINSIVHEAEHIKQAMLKAYQIEDEGESPAYTIGYLISQMYRVFKDIVCNCQTDRT